MGEANWLQGARDVFDEHERVAQAQCKREQVVLNVSDMTMRNQEIAQQQE
jgi:hypothetical protein